MHLTVRKVLLAESIIAQSKQIQINHTQNTYVSNCYIKPLAPALWKQKSKRACVEKESKGPCFHINLNNTLPLINHPLFIIQENITKKTYSPSRQREPDTYTYIYIYIYISCSSSEDLFLQHHLDHVHVQLLPQKYLHFQLEKSAIHFPSPAKN